jgi:hypothetical protein
MSRSGLKVSAVAVASLLLVAVGAHFAWEWHRYRLSTPRGTIRIGMTRAEVEAVLGKVHAKDPGDLGVWGDSDGIVCITFVDDRAAEIKHERAGGTASRIPRPSLFEHVRAWLPGRREE